MKLVLIIACNFLLKNIDDAIVVIPENVSGSGAVCAHLRIFWRDSSLFLKNVHNLAVHDSSGAGGNECWMLQIASIKLQLMLKLIAIHHNLYCTSWRSGYIKCLIIMFINITIESNHDLFTERKTLIENKKNWRSTDGLSIAWKNLQLVSLTNLQSAESTEPTDSSGEINKWPGISWDCAQILSVLVPKDGALPGPLFSKKWRLIRGFS